MAEEKHELQPIIQEPDEILQAPSLPGEYIEYVRKENQKTYDLIVRSLESIDALNKIKEQESILPIASGIKSGCITLIDARRKIRENCQFAFALLCYRPAILNDRSKPLWNCIDQGCILIYTSAMGVMKVNAQFFSHFVKIQDSLGRFLQLNEKGAGFDESTCWLKKDIQDFNKFRLEFENEIKKLSNDAFDTMVNTVQNMKGDATIRTALGKVKNAYNDYCKALQDYHSLEEKKRKEIFDIKTKEAEAEGKKIRAEVEIQFIDGHIVDKQAGLRQAERKSDQLRADFENASNHRQQLASTTTTQWKRSFWWWGRWENKTEHYYQNVWTGEKDRIKSNLDNWSSQISTHASTLHNEEQKKAHWEPLKKQAEMEVERLRECTENIHKQYNSELKNQMEKVQQLKNDYDRIYQVIQDFITATQVDEDNIVDFLKLTSQIPQRALIAHEASTGIGEFIRLFEDLISRRVHLDSYNPKTSIEEVFKEEKLERLIEILKDEQLFIMQDITFNNEDEYKELIDVIKEKNIVLKLGERNKLKKLCLKSQQDKEKENRAKDVLKDEVRGLQKFFYEIHGALDKGCRKLEIVSPQVSQDSMKALAL